MAEDSSSKKFLVSNFNNYKMVDSRPVMEQYNELLRILGQYTQHGLKMDESIFVSSIIDKLPPSWKDFKHTLKHGSQDSDKGKGKEVGGPSVNMTEEDWSFQRDFRSGNEKNAMLVVSGKGSKTILKTQVDAIAWWIDSDATTHVCKDRCWFKTYESVEDGSVLYMGDDHFTPVYGKGKGSAGIAVVRLPDLKKKTLGEKGIDCIFVGYAEHSKAYRFYIIEPNESVSINSIIESRDAIFDENRFSSISRPKDIIPNSVESQRDDHSNDVPSEIPEPRKGKRVRKAKSYGFDFQLYLVEGSRDQKEAIDDEIGSIMENNTWVLSDLPPGCKPLGHAGDPEVSYWLKGRVSDLRVQKGWIGVGYQSRVEIGSSRTLLSSRFIISSL
ncbi:hypothetical protein Tco_1523066 [Tanacetum coccineum]